jgi:nitrogenase molybdenum-iron protein alpha/beta subunit
MLEQLNWKHNNFSKDPLLSCALEGVTNVLAGIKDVCIVIHSPQGCAATVNSSYDQHEVDFTNRKLACTRLFERDIILGATQKLEDMIKQADATYQSKIIFVVGTCAADIIGEDIEAVCRMLQPDMKARLIPIQAGGFRGNSYEGIGMGLAALIPIIKPSHMKINNSVNLISVQANCNPTWWADLEWVKETLEKLDVYIQTVFTHETEISQIEEAGVAGANILLSHEGSFAFSKNLEELHKIPLLLSDLPFPVGFINTARWLKRLGEHFHKEQEVEELIHREEKRITDILRKRALMMIPRYRNCRIALSADSTIGISIVRMLFEELEMIPELLIFKHCPESARRILEEELSSMKLSPKVVWEADGYQIKKALESVTVDMIIGSSWEKYIGEELGIKVIVDAFEPSNREVYVNESYFGYDGMLHLLQVFANDWERAFRSKHISFEKYTAKCGE